MALTCWRLCIADSLDIRPAYRYVVNTERKRKARKIHMKQNEINIAAESINKQIKTGKGPYYDNDVMAYLRTQTKLIMNDDENAEERYYFQTEVFPEVNWACIGNTSTKEARAFAERILKACDLLDSWMEEHKDEVKEEIHSK